MDVTASLQDELGLKDWGHLISDKHQDQLKPLIPLEIGHHINRNIWMNKCSVLGSLIKFSLSLDSQGGVYLTLKSSKTDYFMDKTESPTS